jgi:PAS domain S-box-containing protein
MLTQLSSIGPGVAIAVSIAGAIVLAIAVWLLVLRSKRGPRDYWDDVHRSLGLALTGIEAGLIAADGRSRVTHMNAIAERVTGWTEAEARGRAVSDILSVELPWPAVTSNPVDVVIVARDGTRKSVECRPTALSGDAVGRMAWLIRATEQRSRAEAEEARLAAIVESSEDAIISCALDGLIRTWNAGAQSMFGYSAAEAIGQSVQMLVPAGRDDGETALLGELANGARLPLLDTVRRTKSGSMIEVAVRISPIRDSAGQVVGASKSIRDVSQQRHAEKAARQSEARLRFTVDAARVGEWEIDLKSGVGSHSALHGRIFGYGDSAGEWSVDKFAQYAHPEDRAEVTRTFWAAIGAMKDWNCDYRLSWPDGSTRWVSLRGIPLPENGTPARIVGIVIDMTERMLAEQSRRTSLRLEAEKWQIQEASRLKSQFLASMSHELRTPLNAIIGFADLLYSGTVPRDSTKHQVFIGHIATSGRQLLQLINDVLDLSRLEAGSLEFHAQPVRLPDLLKEAADALRSAKSNKRVDIVEEATDLEALSDVVLDPVRLKQVIHNFLSTAVKYTADGGRVTIRARPEGSAHLRIEVEAPGAGLAEAELPRLFNEFRQFDTGVPQRRQGTDLGLWVSRRLIEAQGGTVGARSLPDKGCILQLTLNRIHGTDAPLEGLSSPAASHSNRRRLLVIKDSGDDQADFTNGLSAAGFEVVQASTAAQAVQQANQETYDAIALDLLLSDQSGLRVLQTIRSEGLSRESPVVSVAMTAENHSTATFAITNVLSKPIDSEELANAMRHFLKRMPRTARVMVIDDDPMAVELMCTTLSGIGIEALGLTDGRRVLEELDIQRPDALVLDLMMPEFDGFAVLDTLRRAPVWRDIPVFIWTNMILTSEDYISLQRSVHTIFSKGGGSLQTAIDDLRNRRQG